MLIYIDEAGKFTPGDGFSVVCALTLPHKSAGPCRRELNRVTRDWPRHKGELKSGSLDAAQLIALVDVLFRYDGLLHTVATDVSKQAPEGILSHQADQANRITKHLTNAHLPSMVASVWDLRRALERMPPQLYVQCIAMHQLVWHVAEEATIYFSQRRPQELEKFQWYIDAKEPRRITSQEKWWRDVIGPLGESRSQREPFLSLHDKSADYRYFDRAFSMEKKLDYYPHGSIVPVSGFDIIKLISDNVSFVDSKSDLFIQAADVLTGFTRRAVREASVDRGILLAIGRLMIRRKLKGHLQTVRLITLADAQQTTEQHLGTHIRTIASAARPMLKPGRKIGLKG